MIDVSKLTDDELEELHRRTVDGLAALRALLHAIQLEDDARHPFPAVPAHVRRVKRVQPIEVA